MLDSYKVIKFKNKKIYKNSGNGKNKEFRLPQKGPNLGRLRDTPTRQPLHHANC